MSFYFAAQSVFVLEVTSKEYERLSVILALRNGWAFLSKISSEMYLTSMRCPPMSFWHRLKHVRSEDSLHSYKSRTRIKVHISADLRYTQKKKSIQTWSVFLRKAIGFASEGGLGTDGLSRSHLQLNQKIVYFYIL